jgi:hypothetical protein
MHAAQSLLEVFSRLEDPRCRRGVRHPFAGMVVLMLLGMLARIREMEVLVRWATVHWGQLGDALGFDRDQPPCATTISRTLAKCRVADFQAAWAAWLQACVTEASTNGVVAVDGKTTKQGLDDNGSPLHMLHVFVHDLQAVIGQWSTGAEKSNEPAVLRRHLEELLDAYPMLRLFTGDALYAQRPLAELVCAHGRDYLLQIAANQGDTLDALQNCFAQAAARRPAAETTDKRGLSKKPVNYGSTSTARTTFVRRSICPAVA